jgi:hypothetical protein
MAYWEKQFSEKLAEKYEHVDKKLKAASTLDEVLSCFQTEKIQVKIVSPTETDPHYIFKHLNCGGILLKRFYEDDRRLGSPAYEHVSYLLIRPEGKMDQTAFQSESFCTGTHWERIPELGDD